MKADGVFEGGGVKGIGLVGAVSVAEERGYEFVNVAGTSAGAIVAALVAAGYSSTQLKSIMDDLDYPRLKDAAWMGPFISLFTIKGMYKGDYFEDWMRDKLRNSPRKVKTFKDLIIDEYRDDEKYRFRLRVVASDISLGEMLVLPQDAKKYNINPEDLDVASAIRMSMSIPFFYKPARFGSKKSGSSYVVDGGVLSNYPVWLFDSEGEPEWPTIGFKLVEPGAGKPNDIGGPVSLFKALFSTIMEAHDERYIEDKDFTRTIPIPTCGVHTTQFDITPAQREELYQSGRKAANKFFDQWHFERYVKMYRTGKPLASRGETLRAQQANSG